jgi:hypothetical protein
MESPDGRLREKAGYPWMITLVYVGLDDQNEAGRWREKAYQQGDFYFDLENPLLDPLSSDSTFHDLRRRMKAAQQGQARK